MRASRARTGRSAGRHVAQALAYRMRKAARWAIPAGESPPTEESTHCVTIEQQGGRPSRCLEAIVSHFLRCEASRILRQLPGTGSH
jgi:hypothetical protein